MTRTLIHAAVLAGAVVSTTMSAAGHDTDPTPRKTETVQPVVQQTGATGSTDAADSIHPRLDGDTMTVTTTSPEAQHHFNHGLALTWSFNHAEAIRFFRAAQALDPGCAMCFWGEALALGPNIHEPMTNAAIRPAWDAMVRARDLAGSTTPREAALITALSARYGINAMLDRGMLDRLWVKAIANVAAAYPEDAGILVLHADALMNLQVPDGREVESWMPNGNDVAILAVLDRALELAPDHPGALHLHFHAMENSGESGRAVAPSDCPQPLATVSGQPATP